VKEITMSQSAQLVTQPAADGKPSLQLRFAAPDPADGAFCAPASLELSNGQRVDLGEICAPTPQDWRRQRLVELDAQGTTASQLAAAKLRWGDLLLAVEAAAGVARAAAPTARPTVTLFSVKAQSDPAFSAVVKVAVTGLAAGQRIRVDGDVGNAQWLPAGDGKEQTWTFHYVKPGKYQVTLELVDAAGYWLATLAETPLEIVEPVIEPADKATARGEPAVDTTVYAAPPEVAAAAAEPWLPFRYARPLWAWTRTYTAAGGSKLSRQLALGTYLAIRQETLAGGQLWYQTGSFDWVPASSVSLMTPSDLRGVVVGTTGPGPNPNPPPTTRRGTVTANVLNVRARPGVAANNPPVASLTQGAVVTIYEETSVSGAVWYRIGTDRWVHSGYIQLIATAQADTRSAATALPTLPIGWVVPASLNVRSAPGTNSPQVGTVAHNQNLPILETQTAAGQPWYRIGNNQWVYGPSIGVARVKARPASIRNNERWVGVSLKEQTLVAYEGDKPVYAALIASGLPGTPTVQGVFRTWWRVDSRRMTGGSGAGYYYLEEVTWTCYFYSGYALHTAYWHDAFGAPRSHGCVNLSPYDAWWVFQWSGAGGANSPAVYVYWT